MSHDLWGHFDGFGHRLHYCDNSYRRCRGRESQLGFLCAFGAALVSATAGGGTREGLTKWQGITSLGIILLGIALFALAYWMATNSQS